jgi:hypothetical protein
MRSASQEDNSAKFNERYRDFATIELTSRLLRRIYWPAWRLAVIEGWYGCDYLILFDEGEIASASDRYAVTHLFAGSYPHYYEEK